MEQGYETLRDAEFKDEQPLKTVERIRNILKENGIEATEYWYESKVPYCYSNRICIKGTNFTVYGKGLTKEFALASGYGELIERLQLGYISSHKSQKVGIHYINDSRDLQIPAQTLLQKNPHWYQALSDKLLRYTGVRMTASEILEQFQDQHGNIQSTVYFNASKCEKEYYPSEIRNWIYTSNGCAAGNTMEEAMVQGISEVVERHHQMRIIDEGITAPDIPEEVLQQYHAAYDIISYVRSQGYKVILKDCSLGEKYPVVCACFINKKTGKYHTHFGAYPIFEIALERALTESFQGYNIDNIGNIEDLLYQKADVYTPNSMAQELVKGTSEKYPSFFVGTPKFAYNTDVGFSGKSNKELWLECVAFFREKGYDVLVRDSSSLGFPTCQILIPGYSENFIFRLSQKLHDHRYLNCAKNTLRNPATATVADMMGLLKHVATWSQYTNIKGTGGFLANAKLSAKLTSDEQNELFVATMAYVFYTLGRYNDVLKYINTMIRSASQENAEYLICLKRYLSLRTNRYDEAEIRKIIEFFHRPETVDRLYSCLENKENPFDAFVLHCDTVSCSEACLLYSKCQQKYVAQLGELINEKKQALCFETFAEELTRLSQV